MRGAEIKATPIRIQLSRKKGWCMPPNTVVVDRRSKWGNPFAIKRHGLFRSIALYKSLFTGWSPQIVDDILSDDRVAEIYALHTAWTKAKGIEVAYDVRRQLRGKNLACWCPLPKAGEPDVCHAAVLLELANA